MGKYSKPGTRPRQTVNPAEREDVFVAKTIQVSQWARARRNVLVWAFVALGVGVVGLVYYRGYRATLHAAAASRLEELQQQVELGDQVAAQADLRLYLDRFAGTPSEDEARMALAQLEASLGGHAAAAEVLEPAAGDVRSPLGAQAAALLASISEDAGNLQVAEALYERLADRAELGFQVRDALADAARLRRARGDLEGALEMYDRLLEDMDEFDPERGVAEMRRAEVVAELR